MRNLLSLGGSALLAFAGIGWYLGWYKVQSTPTATGRNISIDLNTPKIKDDVNRGKDKLRDILKDDQPQSGGTSTGLPSVVFQLPTNAQPTGFQRNTNEIVIPLGQQNSQGFTLPPFPSK